MECLVIVYRAISLKFNVTGNSRTRFLFQELSFGLDFPARVKVSGFASQ